MAYIIRNTKSKVYLGYGHDTPVIAQYNLSKAWTEDKFNHSSTDLIGYDSYIDIFKTIETIKANVIQTVKNCSNAFLVQTLDWKLENKDKYATTLMSLTTLVNSSPTDLVTLSKVANQLPNKIGTNSLAELRDPILEVLSLGLKDIEKLEARLA